MSLDIPKGWARELRESLLKRAEEGQYIFMLLNEHEVRIGTGQLLNVLQVYGLSYDAMKMIVFIDNRSKLEKFFFILLVCIFCGDKEEM